MSKRSFSESIDSDSDEEQEALMVEEIERMQNRLKVLRKGRGEGSISTLVNKNLGKKQPSKDSSWFESEDNTLAGCNNEEIIQIQFEDDSEDDLSGNTEQVKSEEKPSVPQVQGPKENPTNLDPQLEETVTASLDPQVEALLGREGFIEDRPKNDIHLSLAKKWSFILVKGLQEDINEKLLTKYPAPDNCLEIAPPVLNPELRVNMKKEALARDEKQKISQSQLAGALSAIGQALSKLLSNTTLTREDVLSLIEYLSDSGRLLADLHYKNSLHRRFLVLGLGFQQKIKVNIRDVLFNAKIDTFLFGKDLSENLEKAKALERNSLSIVEPSKFQKTNLNRKGPSHHNKNKPAAQGRRDGPSQYYQQPTQTDRPFTARTTTRSDQNRTPRNKGKQGRREMRY